MGNDDKIFEFDFAISYASEDSGFVYDLGDGLRGAGFEVFLDRDNFAKLWGKNLPEVFKDYFGVKTRFVITVISANYVKKEYPRYEFEVAKREAAKKQIPFILPIRLDDTPFAPLHADVAFVEYQGRGIDEVVGECRRLIEEYYAERVVRTPDIWCVTYGLSIVDFLENYIIPDNLPHDYPRLCDYLERDLLRQFAISPIMEYGLSEPALRTGESLSVRIIFRWPEKEELLGFNFRDWWALLELRAAEEIYEDAKGVLSRAVKKF